MGASMVTLCSSESFKIMQTYKVTVDCDKNIQWFNDKDERHRLDGPALEGGNGDKEWWVNNKLHRLDGPACEYADGDKEWYVDGERHRLDGPAIEYADGDKDWYVNGAEMTKEEFNEYIKPKPSCEGKVVEIDGKKYKLVSI
jgi:hypothetical protein